MGNAPAPAARNGKFVCRSRREEALISDLKSGSRYLVSYSPATVPAPRAEKFLGRMTEGQVRQIEDALLEWLVIRRQD
jgi:hypothetical protein